VVQEDTPAQNVEVVEGKAIEDALQKSKEEGQKPPTVIIQPEGKTTEGKNPAAPGAATKGEE